MGDQLWAIFDDLKADVQFLSKYRENCRSYLHTVLMNLYGILLIFRHINYDANLII